MSCAGVNCLESPLSDEERVEIEWNEIKEIAFVFAMLLLVR